MMGSCGAEDCYPPLQARVQGRARAGHTHQLDSHVLICIQVLSWGGNREAIRTADYPPHPKAALSSEQFTEARGDVFSRSLLRSLWPQVPTAQESKALHLSTCMQSPGDVSPGPQQSHQNPSSLWRQPHKTTHTTYRSPCAADPTLENPAVGLASPSQPLLARLPSAV